MTMGLFTMLGETTRCLLRRPATERYPFTPKVYVTGSRGHIAIDVTKCTLCVICDKRCPTQAIIVNREKKTWAIERLRCIQCNYCVEACPKKCLVLESGYSPVRAAKGHEGFDVPYVPPAPKPAAAVSAAN
jgi:ech hydrogenase subunit F